MNPHAELIANVFKIFGIAAFSFFAAVAWTPVLAGWLYRNRMWRKSVRTSAPDGAGTPMFAELHAEREVSTPRLGGLLVWVTTAGVILLFWALATFTSSPVLDKLNFLSRNQTWLPLFTLVTASLLGLIDDLIQIYAINGRGTSAAGGLKFRIRLAVVVLIALAGAYWFYVRLGRHAIYVPGAGDISIGLWFIPAFVLAMLASFSTSVTDGLDGLAGGVFATIFAAYGGIAFFRGQIDLAAFAAALLGSLLAFLWFNIPPARFYMGETGILGLTTTLTVMAFLTDSALVLPIIAFVPAAEAASVIIQLASKRWRGKKVFLIAPLHHHFEARGWPAYKVTMRFWVMSVVCAIIGMTVALIGR